MWLLLGGAACAAVVDRIEVQVGDRVVTSSDLAFEIELDPHDTSPLATLERGDYPLRERLVDFALLRDLAGGIEVFRPTRAEVIARWERFRASWDPPEGYGAFLGRWGLNDADLQDVLANRLVVERFVTRNLAVVTARERGGGDPYPAWIAGLRARTRIRVPEEVGGANP